MQKQQKPTRSKSADIFYNIDIMLNGKHLIKDSKLNIIGGQRYGLVGYNGLGKSVLLKHIYSKPEGTPRGLKIVYVEQEAAASAETVLQTVLSSDVELQMILAEIKSLENNETLADNSEDDRLQRLYGDLSRIDGHTAVSRASRILIGLGFNKNDISRRNTSEYSGGWRMRISLACSLFCRPDLLLLDEPTNHLDLDGCIWLEDYLSNWNSGLIVVSHDTMFLNSIVTNIIHLDKQCLTTYKGDYDCYMKQRTQNKYIPSQHPVKFTFPQVSSIVGPLPVKFKNASFRYPQCDNVFNNLEFSFDLDSRIALVGPNGAGKSTLMNLIDSKLTPTTGEVVIDRHLKIARFTQHHVDMFQDMNVSILDYFASKFTGVGNISGLGCSEQEIRQHLAKFGITQHMPRQLISTLSGGQKSRVAFAELAWHRPHIMLLDEPTNHLDIETIDALADALSRFDGGVVIITHNQRIVDLACNTILMVNNKKVQKFNGDFKEYKKYLLRNINYD